jgi:subtilisin
MIKYSWPHATLRWLRSALLPAVVVAFATGSGLASAQGHAAAARDAQYIVVLNESAPEPAEAARTMAREHGLSVGFVYRNALRGFSATIPAAALQAVRSNPNVAYVEADQVMRTQSQVTPTGIWRVFAAQNPKLHINGADDWRIDVDVAVVDTGIEVGHPDLNLVGRADCSGGSPWRSACTDGAGTDGNGHGTHVAGTIGAVDNGFGVVGVAPGARLWGVKVLSDNGSGYNTWIIAGIDWITARAGTIDVANMSLGGGDSKALCDAIGNSVASGIVYVVAAGNSNKDASTSSPANCADVITVSALADFDGLAGGLASPTCRTDEDDTLANFSNWGSRVHVAAPGVCIRSTWKGGAYHTISGTSMAAPHAAGAAALVVASGSKPANRAQALEVRQKLIASGNFDWTDESGDGIKEPLLDVGALLGSHTPRLVAGTQSGSSPPPPSDTTPPVIGNVTAASITASTAEITWTTNEPATSQVRYGKTNSLGSTMGATTLVSSHAVQLSGLESGTTYLYEVRSVDASGNEAIDNDDGSYYSFTTQSTSEPAVGITLSATGYKVRGFQKVDLAWSGATSTNVDVWRNGSLVATVADSESHTDDINQKGSGTYTYRVCEAGSTSSCSPERTVTF